MGFAVFEQQSSSVEARAFLGRAIRSAGAAPRHLITDHGTQFTDEAFGRWCTRRQFRQRFGAVGKYGSIAVVERFIRSMKSECTRRLLVPYQRESVRRELALYLGWYNDHRPHEWLGSSTPDEVYFDRDRASDAPRIEPRPLWPRGSPCAAPQAEVCGNVGRVVELKVGYLSRRMHLPIVELKRAA